MMRYKRMTGLKNLATLAKIANKEAQKITIKYTKEYIKKEISKYRQLYENCPKRLTEKYLRTLKYHH